MAAALHKHVFMFAGWPKKLVSDQGGEFCNKLQEVLAAVRNSSASSLNSATLPSADTKAIKIGRCFAVSSFAASEQSYERCLICQHVYSS